MYIGGYIHELAISISFWGRCQVTSECGILLRGRWGAWIGRWTQTFTVDLKLYGHGFVTQHSPVWEQPKRPLIDEWFQNVLGTYRRILVFLFSHYLMSNSMDSSTSGFPVLHYLPEFAQTQVHWHGDASQPSHLRLSPSSPPALNLSQHQGLFQWASSSHQVAKVLELQLQHQSFQWIFRVRMLFSLKREWIS